MRTTLETATAELPLGFEPTSVYLDGIQTYDYVYRNGTCFFGTIVAAGVEITAIPQDAVRFDDSETKQVFIDAIGTFSLFAEPSGSMKLSLDGIVWKNAITCVFPTTVHVKPIVRELVTDSRCIAGVELVLWAGGDNAKIDDEGFVTVISGPATGRIEYDVH